MLCGERVISIETLSMVKSTAKCQSEEEALFVLLRAIRHAVHCNYSHLPVFASVLLRFTSTVPCAKDILKDFSKYIRFIIIIQILT